MKNQLEAFCTFHKKRDLRTGSLKPCCTRARKITTGATMKGRPLAELYCWLAMADDFPDDPEGHKACEPGLVIREAVRVAHEGTSEWDAMAAYELHKDPGDNRVEVDSDPH